MKPPIGRNFLWRVTFGLLRISNTGNKHLYMVNVHPVGAKPSIHPTNDDTCSLYSNPVSMNVNIIREFGNNYPLYAARECNTNKICILFLSQSSNRNGFRSILQHGIKVINFFLCWIRFWFHKRFFSAYFIFFFIHSHSEFKYCLIFVYFISFLIRFCFKLSFLDKNESPNWASY